MKFHDDLVFSLCCFKRKGEGINNTNSPKVTFFKLTTKATPSLTLTTFPKFFALKIKCLISLFEN
jgi:hypothetical protein